MDLPGGDRDSRGGVRVFVGGDTDLWRHDDFTTIAYAA